MNSADLLEAAPVPGVTPPGLAAPKARWKPNVTVAALIERDGRFLLVEEDTSDGLLLNNPAGHLDPGESPIQGVIRETLEETARQFTPEGFLGMYMSRFRRTRTGEDITYLRLAFFGSVSEADPALQLDEGIVRAVWMSADEIRACPDRHRSPLLLECLESYLAGERYPLSILTVHDSVFSAPSHQRAA
ncbi:MAG: NUDIX hydrolase [Proteobacteria bacterium]|uniref:NUDIX hydrolase n=1 Tax=Aquabacterium sp. TaxID=1872578 RepID=UPI0035C66627|nr:NUDIX hydrolase [Pseudomonadota bacterium]